MTSSHSQDDARTKKGSRSLIAGLVLTMLAALLSIAPLGASALTATPAPAECLGEVATIVGTSGNDLLVGTRGRDIFSAGEGRDTIVGRSGDDLICAGPGRDYIVAGSGADYIDAGSGRDRVYAGSGNDTIIGGNGRDLLVGSGGNDTIDGGNGYDSAYGGRGDDQCQNVEFRRSCTDVEPGDTQPPSVALLSPTAGIVEVPESGLVTVSGTADDNVALATVTVEVDGTETNATITAGSPSTWTAEIPITTAGQATITVTATDTSNNSTQDEVDVTFELAGDDEPPTITLDTPVAGVVELPESGVITVSGTADDNVALATVIVNIDGTETNATVVVGTPSTWSIDVPVTVGPATISATATDSSDNATTTDPVNVVFEDPFEPPTGPSAIAGSSPFDAESGVALTRETIVYFSTAVDVNTVAGAFDVSTNGSPLTFTPRLSSDGFTITLFYADDLPAQASITVTIDGNQLTGVDGTPVDADRDGVAGGTGTITFDTLSITPVPGTSVFGRVFASELSATPGGEPIDVPLGGVTITVDGAEQTLVTTTDALGNFILDPAPAGRFFVHIDGRTTTNTVDPDEYYPFVGKSWDANAGGATDIGNVYLPLIPAGTLTPTSLVDDIEAFFTNEVLTTRPELNGASVLVPAGSLYSDDGTVGGSVGIAPVDPSRLPGPLPSPLDPAIVVTIQTDGATNFDVPASLCLPNLADPQTGQPLDAGAKTALWSFNHDVGRFEVTASATVSDDGTLVCTDDGQGVLAPGWHFFFDWVTWAWNGAYGNVSEWWESSQEFRENPVVMALTEFLQDGIDGMRISRRTGLTNQIPIFELLEIKNEILDPCVAVLEAATEALQNNGNFTPRDGCGLTPDITPGGGGGSRPSLSNGVSARRAAGTFTPPLRRVREELDPVTDSATIAQIDALLVEVDASALRLQTVVDYYEYLTGNDWMSLEDTDDLIVALNILDASNEMMASDSDEGAVISAAEAAELALLLEATGPTQGELDTYVARLNRTTENYENNVYRHADAAPGADLDWIDLEQVVALGNLMVAALQGEVDAGFDQLEQSYFDALDEATAILDEYAQEIGVEARPQVGGTFVRVQSQGDVVQRTQSGVSGGVNVSLPSNSPVDVAWLDPTTFDVGVQRIITGEPGRTVSADAPYLIPSVLPDADGDGLHDLGENIVGSDPNNPDTDGDGLSDAIELQLGSDPLDGLLVQTGVLATADTAGIAQDVAQNGDVVVVADGDAGVAIFNTFQGMNPVLIAAVDTAGSASRVAVEGNRVLVADGQAGAALVDIADPPNAGVIATFSEAELLGDAVSVALLGDMAWVGTDTGGVVAIDLATNVVSAPTTVGGSVLDLQVQNDVLYALTANDLITLEASATPAELGRLAVAGAVSPGSGRRSLFIAPDVAYIVFATGLATVDITDASTPTAIGTGATGLTSWQDVALNGNGLAVGAGGPSLGLDSTTSAVVYDVSDPANIGGAQTQFATSGEARAVAIANGVAYFADGSRGLQVVNYLAYDSAGQPPTVALAANTPGNEVGESTVLPVFAEVTDDVQVRSVEFLVDGETVATDGSFPFTVGVAVPTLAEQAEIVVTAVATDTGGNSSSTSETYTVTSDTTAPVFVNSDPLDSTLGIAVADITLDYDEVVLVEDDALITLTEVGPDLALGGGDDTVVTFTATADNQTLTVTPTTELPTGDYVLVVSAGAVADSSANPTVTDTELAFSAIPEPPVGTVVWISAADGNFNDAFNWHTGVVPTTGDAVIIDRPNQAITVTVTANATVASITSTEDLVVSNGTLTVNDGSSNISGALTVANRRGLTATGSTTAFVASGPATINGALLRADAGASIRIDNASEYISSGGNGISESRRLLTADGAGSVLDLPGVTTMTGTFSGLGGLSQNHYATNGGQILLPAVTQVTGGGSGSNGGGPYRFISSGGGSFDLTGLETTTGTGAGIRFQTADSVNLPSLTSASLTAFYPLAGGTYDAPLLATLSNRSEVWATGGTTFTAPLLAEVLNSTLRLDGASTLTTGTLTDITLARILLTDGATFALPTTLTSYSSSGGHGVSEQRTLFSADGAGTTLDLSSLQDITGTFSGLGGVRQFITASNGGVVDLSGLNSLTGGGSGANGGGPLVVREQTDGNVLLDSLATTSGTGAGVSLSFDGDTSLPLLTSVGGTTIATVPNGELNLAALEEIAGITLDVTDGRSVLMPALTVLEGSDVTIGDTGVFQTGTLTSINQTEIRVQDGASFATPASLTSYVSSRGHGVSEQRTLFAADGAGSTLDLSSIQTLTGTFSGLGGLRQLIVASDGATIDLSGVQTVAGGGTGANGGGPYEFRTVDSTSSMDLSSLTTATGNGAGVLFTNGGTMTLNPGASTMTATAIVNNGQLTAGSIDLSGSFTQGAAGTLALDAAGTAAGTDYPQITLTGTGTIAGTVDVTVVAPFVPAAGDQLVVIAGSGLTGAFDTTTVAPLSGGLTASSVVDSSGATITIG